MSEHPPSLPEDPSHALRELVAAGRFGDALAWFEGAPASVTRDQPHVQLLVATAATRLGRDSMGMTLAADAFETFRLRADEDGRMRASNLLGALHWQRGHLDEAERCFNEALTLAHQLGDLLVAARACQNLALVAYLRSDYDVALSLYRTALLEYQRLGDRRHTAETHHNLAVAFRLLEAWDEAESAVTQAVRHAQLVNDPSLLAFVLIGRAELALARAELDVAQRALLRADHYAAAGDATARAETTRVNAMFCLAKNDATAARRAAEAAYDGAVQINDAVLRADCAATLALACERAGDTTRALELRAEALRSYTALGAVAFRERFEKDWSLLKHPNE
ncbi:MAG: tetratricopeptide repeat protein [Gemmatimonadaceae bacterium]